ncbi:hypothetical protein M3Y94_00129100 [Aphelenchoides besseyi]|nr:hypothetical protein M3Y94_00129100 [Aphelenchoides besseyi]KAI6237358.1 hypothetical protein M3Y95_00256500 [Aphelenchoides besseyi]
MDFIGKAKQSIAKAVQIASESSVFSSFPECSLLSSVDRISIKLKDPQLHGLMKNWGPEHTFKTIDFLIRNEATGKQTILEAELESGRGITVRNAQGKQIMVVKLNENDPTALGKLCHPSLASLYKVIPSQPTPLGVNYIVQHAQDRKPYMLVEKVPVSLHQVLKVAGILGTNTAYWIKNPADGTVLGYVRAKLVMNSNTLVVKFMSNNRDPQVRTTILGVALLLTISESYPQLRAMLQESMHKTDGI